MGFKEAGRSDEKNMGFVSWMEILASLRTALMNSSMAGGLGRSLKTE